MSSNVNLGGLPLNRLNPFYPGQFGVPGTDSETGLRQHSTGTVFYVDPNYPGASDARDGTDPTSPLLTVAAALTKCQDYRGDVVAVMGNGAWQYADTTTDYATGIAEEVEMTVHGVRLVGVFPSSPVGVVWSPASNAGTCITVSAMDCLIEGFAFTEGAFTGTDAIYAEWDGATLWADNLVVRHCVFDDSVDTAIQLEYTWYAQIHDCFFQENDVRGIWVDTAGSGAAYLDIYRNRFQNCAIAMTLHDTDDSMIHDNFVYNQSAVGAGVATNEGLDTTGGTNNLVANNFFSCLLPVPANGDWDDLNSGVATDAWVGNQCQNGQAITTPT